MFAAMTKIYRITEFAKRIGRDPSTIRRWEREGKIQSKRFPSGQRYFDESDVRLLLGGAPEKRKTIVYCRVSSSGQKDDLASQVEAMEIYCRAAGLTVDEWIQEIGAGMNFKRKKFLALLQQIMRGEVAKLVVAHKDRLMRFGFDCFEHIATESGCEVKIPGLERGKRVAIPLNTTLEPRGTLRLILRDGRVEVHYTIEAKQRTDCGAEIIGLDKGYSEVFVDSDGEYHGTELGGILRSESDRLKLKNQRRARLRALAENTRCERKRRNILKHNLGRQKLNRCARKTEANIRDVVFKAAHAVVDKASPIGAEDLSAPMSGNKFGKNMNRRLTSWTKGVIAEALDSVSRRRGATLVLINPAYTSQVDHRNGCLLGKRVGGRFHCFDGVVFQADENAAQNVRARLFDPEIDRWTPFQKVKSILLERTERHRLGLLNQEPSCASDASTGSEMPISNFA